MSLPKLPSLDEDITAELKKNRPTGDGGVSKQGKLPSLPSLDELDGIGVTEQSPPSRPSTQSSPSVPKATQIKNTGLPSLSDFNYPNTEDVVEDVNIDDLPTYDELSLDTGFTKIDTDEEAVDFDGKTSAVSGFEGIDGDVEYDEDLIGDVDDFLSDIDDDIESFDDEEEYDVGNEDEDDFDPSEFSLIPTMAIDNGDIKTDGTGDKLDETPLKKGKIGGTDSKGFKEFDDESVKRFFENIKSKLFKKNKDNIDNADDKKLGIIGGKPKRSKDKAKKPLSQITIIYMVVGLLVVGLVVFGFIKWNGQYDKLEDKVQQVKVKEDSDIDVKLSEFIVTDNKVSFTVENNADISADFFMHATFINKKYIPFTADEIYCISDIIALETGQTLEGEFTCDNLDESLEYKLKIEVNELP